MRSYIRLLAPLSILATALYLAFLASNKAESNSFPITTVDNQKTIFAGPPKMDVWPLRTTKLKTTKTKAGDGTAKTNQP